MNEDITNDEYIESLINISRLTTKDNSILFNFNIEGDKCYNKVTLMEQSGENSVLKEKEFNVNDEFYKEFLDKMILEFHNNCEVMFSDSVDLDKDNLVTYRMVTLNNDLFTIDGLTQEYANHLSDIVTGNKNTTDSANKVIVKSFNDKGLSNSLMIMLIIIFIFLVILIYLLFINK